MRQSRFAGSVRLLALLLVLPLPGFRSAAAPIVIGEPGRLTTITREVSWPAGTAIQLVGPVVVDSGGVLRIAAGARVEASVGAFIAVSRDGWIDAAGTLEEPVELTCATVPRFTGCWGGLIVQGNARINVGETSSPAGGRGGVGGCRESLEPIVPELAFGGCNDADSSGALRHLRIEYAERGLQLQGVGSTTVIERVQVNRSRFDGALIIGGTANARELFLTANGTGLRWSGGWRGAAQRVAIQQDVANFRAALVGQNASVAGGDVDAEPRSAPTLFNLTILAQSIPGNPTHASARALVFERGTAGTLRNAFLYAPHVALDIVDAATCLQLASGALSLRHVVTAGATSAGEGTVDAACGRTEAEVLGDPAAANVVLPLASGLLASSNDLLLPDLRPVAGAALATATAAAPGGGFISGPAYVGAVQPAAQSGQIPWFSGWTNPAPTPAPIPNGTVAGRVVSPFRGALAGVTVRDAVTGASAVTTAAGTYSLSLPAGTALLEVPAVPVECTVPGARSAPVQPMMTTAFDLSVDCWPFPGNTRIDAGDGFACGVADQGTFCWGLNTRGQLGNGTTTDATLPVQVFGTFTSVAAGLAHACGREVSGVVRCWGAGDAGQTGVGPTIDRPIPAPVSGGHLFAGVTSGRAHSCAVKADGSVWCWGDNTRGQLGDGSTTASGVPVQVASSVLFAAVSAGGSHTCALDRAGAAYCWGDGTEGQLGDGTSVGRAVPAAVATLERFAAIAGGGDAHSCATTAAGGVRCWGANESGQLGDGTQVRRLAPVAVASGQVLGGVALGARHSCAVREASTIGCWGLNTTGQRGDGTLSIQSTPTTIVGSPNMSAVTAGPDFSCGITFGAVTSDGGGGIIISLRSLLCWGRNERGEFGRGDQASSLTPVPGATGLTFPR